MMCVNGLLCYLYLTFRSFLIGALGFEGSHPLRSPRRHCDSQRPESWGTALTGDVYHTTNRATQTCVWWYTWLVSSFKPKRGWNVFNSVTKDLIWSMRIYKTQSRSFYLSHTSTSAFWPCTSLHLTKCRPNSVFPALQVQMSKRYGKFGKFTFTAHASGQHYLCFQTNSTRFSVFAGERLVRPMDTNRKEKIHE